jgi:hypothetical protein
MPGQISELEMRKRRLVAESELYRQEIQQDVTALRASTAWVPQSAKAVRAVYPILLLAVPLIAYRFARKRSPSAPSERTSSKRGWIASALAGYRLFKQVKPVLDGLSAWKRG